MWWRGACATISNLWNYELNFSIRCIYFKDKNKEKHLPQAEPLQYWAVRQLTTWKIALNWLEIIIQKFEKYNLRTNAIAAH